ncbi:importin-11 [Danaus plexippus]|uniref:importin-11 n=1 Tax=Danaus plexippus TaxID=13037 RepID=UPI0013C3FAC6|nr:importin-11 [Danaus plexippus plexippus]XP_061379471.1 importin-11 [Danaus plexippus]XP_061379472.1 importin-11 [Danaus plexippus]
MDPNIYALVLDTLNRATSQDAEVLKPAEKKLQEWEVEPGFYSVLLNVLSNHSIDINVRWLAVMCFKNGVDRYWRRNAPNAITDEEKQKLRQGLLTSPILSEPIAQIATQQAVLISKIARFDCPTNWPTLLPDLTSAMKAPQSLLQHRSLLIFHHVVKALASKRLIEDKRTFQELTNSVYAFILNLWHENTECFLRHIQEGASTELITEHLEKALLCLRILRKLTVFGFKKPHESQDAVAFLNVVFDRAKTSLECRKLLKGRGIYPLELCEKFIIHLTKVALGVLSCHPFSYMPLIRPSLEFTLYYCFTEVGMSLTYERFTIQCLNILKGILQCVEYKLPKGNEPVKEPIRAQAHQLKWQVLDQRTVCHMCRHLVTHYFLLTADDLALWDAEPESFATDEAGESWKYSLKPCTEAVFLELFHEYRSVLAPELVRMLASLQETQVSPDDLPAILKKDAIYNAVGLAAFDLYDDVDFDEWFTNVLSKELKIEDNNYRIIRRRVCQLISHWCGVRASQSLRPAMYTALLEPLTRKGEDPAVKLAAAEALRSTIDDFNFDVEQFAPFAPHALSALYDLLVECTECETKMHVLHVVSYVTERCGWVVARGGGGGAGALFAVLPALCLHAAHHHMLRAAALAALVHLVKALGECDPSVRPWVLNVINESTKLSEPAHVYLLEDALELWLAVLETSPAADQPLLQLAHNLYPILEQSTEHLRIVVYIMQAYALLCPEEFFTGAGAKCMSLLDDMLSDMRTEGVITVLKMAEICISVTFPERNAFLGVKVIWPTLIRVIHCLLEGDDLPMVLSVQLCLLSRVILISSDLFYKVVQEAAAGLVEYSSDPVKVLTRLLHVWTEKMNLVTQVERWKVVGLGLAALLTTHNAAVLERFPAVLLNLTEVLNDVMKMEESGNYVDALLSPPGSRPASPLEGRGGAARWEAADDCAAPAEQQLTAHEIRRRRFAAAHPARALDLRAVTHHQLETLKTQVGPETFERLLQSTDKDTIKQLREYIPL